MIFNKHRDPPNYDFEQLPMKRIIELSKKAHNSIGKKDKQHLVRELESDFDTFYNSLDDQAFNWELNFKNQSLKIPKNVKKPIEEIFKLRIEDLVTDYGWRKKSDNISDFSFDKNCGKDNINHKNEHGIDEYTTFCQFNGVDINIEGDFDQESRILEMKFDGRTLYAIDDDDYENLETPNEHLIDNAFTLVGESKQVENEIDSAFQKTPKKSFIERFT